MRYLHLINAVFCEPWALRPDFLSNFSRQLLGRMKDNAAAPRHHDEGAAFTRRHEPLAALAPGQPIVGPVDDFGNPIVPQMVRAGGLAVIPVWGVLGRRLSLLDMACGGCDYEHLTQFFQMAALDPSVRMVVLDMDTPGGRILGLPECAAALAALAAVKPVIAYSSGLCCSAGYYLACFAREFYASPSAQVGNIGVIIACVDDSEEWKQQGLALELFVSGPVKGAGQPGKPWTPGDRAFFQSKMETARDDFFSVVASQRPQVSTDCLDGRWTGGAEAQSLGLIDGISLSLQELVGVAAFAASLPEVCDAPCLDDPSSEPEPC